MNGTTFTIYPPRIARDIVLFLPDRKPDLGLINNIATSEKRLVAMRSTHTNPNGKITYFENTGAMDAGRMTDAETGNRFIQNPITFS